MLPERRGLWGLTLWFNVEQAAKRWPPGREDMLHVDITQCTSARPGEVHIYSTFTFTPPYVSDRLNMRLSTQKELWTLLVVEVVSTKTSAVSQSSCNWYCGGLGWENTVTVSLLHVFSNSLFYEPVIQEKSTMKRVKSSKWARKPYVLTVWTKYMIVIKIQLSVLLILPSGRSTHNCNVLWTIVWLVHIILHYCVFCVHCAFLHLKMFFCDL